MELTQEDKNTLVQLLQTGKFDLNFTQMAQVVQPLIMKLQTQPKKETKK